MSDGLFTVPAAGSASWTFRIDLAAGIELLPDRVEFLNETRSLTGGQPMSLHEISALLRRRAKKPLAVGLVPVDEYVDRQKAASST